MEKTVRNLREKPFGEGCCIFQKSEYTL